MLGARNRLPANSKRPASADPNGGRVRTAGLEAGLLAPLKVALQPLAASDAPNGGPDPKEHPLTGPSAPLKVALQPLAASDAPNGGPDPKEHPLTGPSAPLKVALQPLAAGDGPGPLAPPAVPERPPAREALRALGNPRPRARASHRLCRGERSPASNRERPIAISCLQAWRPSNDPSRNAWRPEAYRQFVERSPQSGSGLVPKAGPRSPARRSSPLPSSSPHPSSKRSGSTERKRPLRGLSRSPFAIFERRSSRQPRVTKHPEIWTASFVRSSTGG